LPPSTALLAQDETDLLLFPPLHARWLLRGQVGAVSLTGRNQRQVLFGALNLRTGSRILEVQDRKRAREFEGFLDVIREHYRDIPVALLLDEERSHTAQEAVSLADDLDIELIFLPKRAPKLNPLDTLWGDGKRVICANRQHRSIEEQVALFVGYLMALSPREALHKAGVLSNHFWLRSVL
jgi:transposase